MNIIISIKPKYANLILKGEKTVEFRKSYPKKYYCLEKVYIYASSPVKKIVGEFKIRNVMTSTHLLLCDHYAIMGCLTLSELSTYKGKSSHIFGWVIKDLIVYEKPIDIKSIMNDMGLPKFTPPQSWRYINPTELLILNHELKEMKGNLK